MSSSSVVLDYVDLTQSDGDSFVEETAQEELKEYVLSVDIGPRNCAWVLMDHAMNVLIWEKFEFDSPFTAHSLSGQTSKKVDQLMQRLPPTLTFDVVIERQMTYNQRFSAVNSVIEACYHCIFAERGCHTFVIHPNTVKKMFNLKSKKEKKHDAVQRVIHILEDRTVKASDEVQLMFYQEEKQDDMADCMLQAVTFIRNQN
jgi:hypothetical protein